MTDKELLEAAHQQSRTHFYSVGFDHYVRLAGDENQCPASQVSRVIEAMAPTELPSDPFEDFS